MSSKVTTIAGAAIAFVQAMIILVNAFGWVEVTGEQAAAITAAFTAAVTVVAHVLVNDQIDVALNTPVPAIKPTSSV